MSSKLIVNTIENTTGTHTINLDSGDTTLAGGLTVDSGDIKLDGNYPVGTGNVALGNTALDSNVSGASNTAIGADALTATTASNNTAVGYQAGYSNTTFVNNTYIGYQAGYNALGGGNTYLGKFAGGNMTSGQNNTILGAFSGNQGGLDIRTTSNRIVLSDGDGNPNLHCQGGNTHINSPTANPTLVWQTAGVTKWYQYSQDGDADTLRITSNFTAGVKLTTSATSWAAFSDERMKDIIEPIDNAVQKVSNLRSVIGKYKTDGADVRRAFLIAQDLQANLPEAVDPPDQNGMLSARYTDVVPLLVAAIKEQATTIEALEARITALEAV